MIATEGPLNAPALEPRVAYVTSRFPKLSETFILFEMDEVAKLGVSIDLYALVREQPVVIHPEAERWLPRATFGGRMSTSLIGAQIYWLRRRPGTYLSAWAGALKMNIRSPRFLARAIYVVPAASYFARHMVEARTEHIHAHYATHPALAAWVAAKLTEVPYSLTAHAHDVYVNTTGLKRKASDASFVVAISEYNKQRLLALAPAAHVVVIRTGTDLAVFQPHQREAAAVLTIVAVGSLEPYKGHRYLVEACRILAETQINFRCLIIGEGPERTGLEQLIRRAGIEGRLSLLGAMTRDGVRDALLRADIFVLPSVTLQSGKMEGIPVVLMEAMAMELPVIASRLSGIPELVEDGDTGVLVSEGSAEELAAAIQDLAADPDLRRRLGTNGRKAVLRSFDIRRSARALADLFAASARAS